MEKVKRRWKTALLCLGALLGVCLTAWPLLAVGESERTASAVTADYRRTAEKLEDAQTAALLAAADAYNAALDGSYDPEQYNSLLRLTEDGMMGYIEIPKIGVELPIYHGTDTATLAKGVGHLPQTSLPVGGEGVHTALSAHSGMSGARMFTDLALLQEGDLFYIHILDRTLTYRVDEINTVLPQDTELLEMQPGEDLCTLITCTPYGINTHRLLVRGRRVEAEPEADTAPEAAEPDTEATTPSIWTRQYLFYIAIGTVTGLAAGGVILFLKIKQGW